MHRLISYSERGIALRFVGRSYKKSTPYCFEFSLIFSMSDGPFTSSNTTSGVTQRAVAIR